MEASGIRGKLVEFKGTPVESHGHQGKKVEASGNKCKPVESDWRQRSQTSASRNTDESQRTQMESIGKRWKHSKEAF